MTQATLFRTDDLFLNRKTNDITFKGKLSLPIHRWYRLTPSFSPQLACDIADHFAIGTDDFVLDPFSGVGTVPLCMKYRGIPAASVELNPYLHFVSTVKTRTYRDHDAIDAAFTRFMGRVRRELNEIEPSARRRYLVANARFVPQIHRPERWWSVGNLAQLVGVRKCLLSTGYDPIHHDLLRMAVLAILVPVSNAKHNHVSLTFADEPLQTIDIASILEAKLNEIGSDLRQVAKLADAPVMVHHGNSKNLSALVPSDTVSAVITSPPYPNRFSYARETRPHLFYGEFIQDARAVGALEIEAIGGTWGKATSILANGVRPLNGLVADLLQPFLRIVPGHGALMGNYVIKYFNDIFVHAGEIARVCKRQARLAYVIGNSKFYGQVLPSDEILASIFGHFGFACNGIERIRKRQSKTGLYEAIVLLER